jgi:hypothetical protein
MIPSGRLRGARRVLVCRRRRGLQPAARRDAFVDAESGLGRQVMAAPADAVVFHGAAHAVVGHGAVLQTDAAPALKRQVKNERSSAVPQWVGCGPMGSRKYPSGAKVFTTASASPASTAAW